MKRSAPAALLLARALSAFTGPGAWAQEAKPAAAPAPVATALPAGA